MGREKEDNPPRWEGKSKGTPLGYRIFFYVCRTWGLFPAYLLLRFVAFYYFVFSWSTSHSTYRYFRNRLGQRRVSAIANIYRNYFRLGQTLLDKVVVLAEVDKSFTYHFDGGEHLSSITNEGKGGILLSAHVGNWEMAGHNLKRLKAKINIVMFDGEHEQIKRFLNDVTGARNFRIITVREDMSHVYAIGEALANNELVCLHADRFLEGNKTITKHFLGADARFPAGPFSLAAGFNVPVSFVFSFKETSRHYHNFASPPMHREPGEGKHDFVNRLSTAFVRDLENKLSQFPEQWFNYYNFWEIDADSDSRYNPVYSTTATHGHGG